MSTDETEHTEYTDALAWEARHCAEELERLAKEFHEVGLDGSENLERASVQARKAAYWPHGGAP